MTGRSRWAVSSQGVPAAEGGSATADRADAQAELILRLQAASGNAATTRLLQGEHEPVVVQRTPDTATRAVGITEHPLAPPQRIELEPTGLEGVHQAEVDEFVGVVLGQLALWRGYRTTFDGDPPGVEAFRAARRFTRWAHDAFRNDENHGPGGLYDARLRDLLARRLGPEQLYYLREVIAFGESRGSIDAEALRELFDDNAGTRMPRVDLRHSYSLSGSGQVGVTRQRGFFVTSLDHVVLHYRNTMGMTYDKPLAVSSLGVTAVPGMSWSADPSGITATGPQHTGRFWPPHYFESAVTIGRLQAGASAGIGPLTGASANYLLQGLLQFTGNGGMDFDLATGFSGSSLGDDGISVDPSARHGRAGISFSGPEVRGGMASGDGPVAATAPRPGPPRTRATGGWQRWTETHLYFPTGVGSLDSAGRATVDELAERVRARIHDHPDTVLRFGITGHTSRRWSGPQSPDRPPANDRLSQMRAEEVLTVFRQALRLRGLGEGSDHILPIVDGAAFGLGAQMATDRGDAPSSDEHDERRVDVVVELAETGIVTDEPAT